MSIIQFLDQHNGSLMVVITLAYAVVTVLIWISNSKSAKATRKQVETSQAQYDETKRREMMPCFYISTSDGSTDQAITIDLTNSADGKIAVSKKCIVLENVGNGIAKDVVWIFHSSLVRTAIIEKGMLLPPNRTAYKSVIFDADLFDKEYVMPYSGQFEIQCTDLEENRYCQFVDVEFTPIPNPRSPYDDMIFEIKQISAPKLVVDKKAVALE